MSNKDILICLTLKIYFMKTLIKITLVALFGIEICSPFLVGYLNHKQKSNKIYSADEAEIVLEKTAEKDWRDIDFTGNTYSDSKTYTVKE